MKQKCSSGSSINPGLYKLPKWPCLQCGKEKEGRELLLSSLHSQRLLQDRNLSTITVSPCWNYKACEHLLFFLALWQWVFSSVCETIFLVFSSCFPSLPLLAYFQGNTSIHHTHICACACTQHIYSSQLNNYPSMVCPPVHLYQLLPITPLLIPSHYPSHSRLSDPTYSSRHPWSMNTRQTSSSLCKQVSHTV